MRYNTVYIYKLYNCEQCYIGISRGPNLKLLLQTFKRAYDKFNTFCEDDMMSKKEIYNCLPHKKEFHNIKRIFNEERGSLIDLSYDGPYIDTFTPTIKIKLLDTFNDINDAKNYIKIMTLTLNNCINNLNLISPLDEEEE